MDSVDAALALVWPVVLRTERTVMRPVEAGDATLVRQLLTDVRVRRYLGGPATEDRVTARQREYPEKAGAWAVAPSAGGDAFGLVTISADARCPGRAEVSYQLSPSSWGQGLATEAVGAAATWWSVAVPDAPLVAVTRESNRASRLLLETLGMVLVESLVEYDEPQCVYTPAGSEVSDLPWLRLAASRAAESEHRWGAETRATVRGRELPHNLSALDFEALAHLCRARHGAHGRICAQSAGHLPDLHLGRVRDGSWIAWRGNAAD
ncbi:GNAT family N-acetyltransferase [Streptacidiphilus sp. EB103A]|uniref:GNAT family N-acetyltransferase n=1 Tax=Streptacidiphilus sp. EB103A TaxID=3156275 RepID=UPI0035170587